MPFNSAKPRSFRVRFVTVFILLLWSGAAAILWVTTRGLAWWEQSALENRLRPREFSAAIKSDLRMFQTEMKRLPRDLREFAALPKPWTFGLLKNREKVFQVGACSAVQFRNYTYLFANLSDGKTAVLWIIPSVEMPAVAPDDDPSRKESARQLAKFYEKTALSHFLVFSGSQTKEFQGMLKEKFTLPELSKRLEPSARELFEMGLLEKTFGK